MAAILKELFTPTLKSVHIIPAVLLDLENVIVAFEVLHHFVYKLRYTFFKC